MSLQAERLGRMTVTQEYCTLLLLEVLYLWNSLPTCGRDDVKLMLQGASTGCKCA